MKRVDEMPTSGQFVAVWQCKDGYMDCANLQWSREGVLHVATGKGYKEVDFQRYYKDMKAKYIIAD